MEGDLSELIMKTTYLASSAPAYPCPNCASVEAIVRDDLRQCVARGYSRHSLSSTGASVEPNRRMCS
jgi:hypothetical protein